MILALAACEEDPCNRFAGEVCEQLCVCGKDNAYYPCALLYPEGTATKGFTDQSVCERSLLEECNGNDSLDVDACSAALETALCTITADGHGLDLPTACDSR